MVQHVHQALGEIDIGGGVPMLENIAGEVHIVADISGLIGYDEDLVEHHLARAPHGVHDLLALTGVLLSNFGRSLNYERRLRWAFPYR